MWRVIGPLIEIGLLVYCLIDCIQTDADRIRNLPKAVWVILIILLPVVGPVAWLIAGRPQALTPSRTTGNPEHERPRGPRGPDDDPDFLSQMRAIDAEHEKALKQWEEDLRERERRLREEGPGEGTPDGPPPAPSH